MPGSVHPMSRPLVIVMYHYVRDAAHTRYPGINGLSVNAFRGQLDYLQAHHTIVTTETVLAAIDGESDALPENPVWLTFDDGYRDHIDTVLPILCDRGLSAAFFPPAQPIVEGRVLDVNKIHFILAASPDSKQLASDLMTCIAEARSEYGLESPQDYYDRWARPGRWDSAEVIFLKRVLQNGLPRAARAEITERLFRQFVTGDEAAFAEELYMTQGQLRDLLGSGMYVGSHGYGHDWMDSLPAAEQERDIDLSLDFLADLGAPTENWIMCYPYGAYDDGLLSILRRKGCAAGVTVETGIAWIGRDDPLTLKRLDTNDLPCHGAAEPNHWTRQAVA